MTPSEKLYNALNRLSEYQKKNPGNLVIHGYDTLGGDQTRLLLESGYLSQVLKGWYIPSRPENTGDTTVWYASYWNFISKYMDDRFGTQWSLSPELSLYLHGGNTVIPKQLIVRSPLATNNIQTLPHGTSVLDIKSTIPKETSIHPETGARVYSVGDALLQVAPDYYMRNTTEALVCLSMIDDESSILRTIAETGNPTKGARLIGALNAVGKVDLAGRMLLGMKRMGYYNTRTENPFKENYSIPKEESPYAARIGILWSKMKKDLQDANVFKDITPSFVDKDKILRMMDEYYLLDSYHSLSIEGYVVSQALLDRVRSGKWDPEKEYSDKKERNALAARGYYQAYNVVKASIKKILDGKSPAEVFVSDHREWHYQLFEPSVRAGILSAADLAGYRNHPVYIRGSQHTPVGFHAVPGCMKKLEGLMLKESDPLIRATLGHFFFTHIHPYMDGNGRTARFLMNTQLASAGYGWIIIPKEMRERYMSALEKAGVENNVTEFGRLIADLIKNPLKPKITVDVNNIDARDTDALRSLGVDDAQIASLARTGYLEIHEHNYRPAHPWDGDVPKERSTLRFAFHDGTVFVVTPDGRTEIPLRQAIRDAETLGALGEKPIDKDANITAAKNKGLKR